LHGYQLDAEYKPDYRYLREVVITDISVEEKDACPWDSIFVILRCYF